MSVMYRSIRFLSMFIVCALHAEKAVVIVPVADLVGQPMKEFFRNRPVAAAYYMLPWWPGNGPVNRACPRLHQLLFNEVVELLKVQGQEVLIRVPHVFYVYGSGTKPQTDYWTLKQNIMSFSELAKRGVDTAAIPDPIDFQNTDLAICHRNTVTLTHPFHDSITNQTFSAGTRFVTAPQQTLPHKVTVFAVDPHCDLVKSIALDKKIARSYENHSAEQRIRDFVELLREWAHANSIPYLWGGCSFTRTYHPDSCHERISIPSESAIPRLEQNTPKTGIDCSCLVLRTAQIVGIPYFCKNTHTLAQYLAPIAPHEHVSDGDLIWIKGHVMVVSNRAKNLLIEARTYDSGYGRVHEIALKHVFKGITTYDDLERACTAKQALRRLNNKGGVSETFNQCKLFDMKSVWRGRVTQPAPIF